MGSRRVSGDEDFAGRSILAAYPEALKQVAVIGLCSGEESAQQVADRLSVCRPTLYNWRDLLLGHEAASSMKRRNTSAPAPEREELERQLEASNAMSANCSLSMIC